MDEMELMPHTDKHVAKYDFTGTTDIELHFKKGNVIRVLEKEDNGWWQGMCQGQVGWFPESYVDPTPIKVAVETTHRKEREGAPGSEVEKPKSMDETMANGEGERGKGGRPGERDERREGREKERRGEYSG